jgi:large subunit ribosomal protein L5
MAKEKKQKAPKGKGGGKKSGGDKKGAADFKYDADYTPRLRTYYQEKAVPALTEKFKPKNPMMVPRLTKVVLNMGLGQAVANPKIIDSAVEDMRLISGQAPTVRRARKSIASFKLREGLAIGVKVTLRRNKMWEFVDRLFNVALPRVRDFKGMSPKGFDGSGNYTMGIKEQIIFPEIDYDKVDAIRGMNISFVTSAESNDEGRELLQLLGMPFRRPRPVEPKATPKPAPAPLPDEQEVEK